jgi:hypothetical protein
MDLNEVLKFAIEPTLIGKRFIIAFMVVASYLAAVFIGTDTAGMKDLVLAVVAFYFGSHTTNVEKG